MCPPKPQTFSLSRRHDRYHGSPSPFAFAWEEFKSCKSSPAFQGFPHVDMQPEASSNPHPLQPDKARFQRARSVPSPRPFRVAVFFCAIHYLGVIASLTALVCFFMQPSQAASRVLIGAMIFSAITWLIAFFKRRSTYCPLCKGTPLINSGARTHVRARRILPFNHGTTAVLSILASQKFRCMYCGSDYDLLKPPTRLLRGADPADAADPSPPHDNRS